METFEKDQQQIRALIANWSKAVEAKDADAIVADYAEDAVLYDAIPPYKVVGSTKIRDAWAACLPYFPESFEVEHRDLVIHASGDLAIAHGLTHFNSADPEHPCGQTWMRVTVGYRRTEGGWKVVHEHISLPFHPMTNQVWSIQNPEVVDAPEYGEMS